VGLKAFGAFVADNGGQCRNRTTVGLKVENAKQAGQEVKPESQSHHSGIESTILGKVICNWALSQSHHSGIESRRFSQRLPIASNRRNRTTVGLKD